MADQDRDDAAAIATEQLIRTVIGISAQMAVILAFSWAYQHADDVRDGIRDRYRALAELARRRPPLPPDAGLQAREFAAAVSAWDHGERA